MKRGMSPLVSGILLLAFSLFIGMTIISWAAQSNVKHTGGCAHISFVSLNNEPLSCVTSDSIRLALENTGSVALQSVLIQLRSDSGVRTFKENFPLEPGYANVQVFSLPLAAQSIKVVPVGARGTCAESGITLEPPRICT